MKTKRLFALLLTLCMIASTFVAMPVSAATTTNVIDINAPLDDASELTFVGSSVTVSNADGVGGRDDVVKAEGVKDSINNTVGIWLPDGFAFEANDVVTYSVDVYSESVINPDMWLRNHLNGYDPCAVLYEESRVAGAWTTVTQTLTYDELTAKITASGSFAEAHNYAFYMRPRTTEATATVYLDNLKFKVTREVVARENVIDITVNSAADITWKNGGTATDANGIGGRDGVVALGNLANDNGKTAGVKLPEGFAFQAGDILTYSFDVYSDTVTNPDIWLRNHGSSLNPFTTFYHTSTLNTWTTITKTVSYDEISAFGVSGNYALYVRPRQAGTIYVDNFKVTVSRPVVEKFNPVDVAVDSSSDITWTGSEAVTVSDADGIGGRNGVIKAEGIANSNSNTVGVKLGDKFAFREGDVLTYSVDVYSDTAVNPDIWLRNHTNLPTLTTFYNTALTANTWTTLTKTVTYADLVATGITGWDQAGTYALYIRPRDSQNATIYLDNFNVTVTRIKTGEPTVEKLDYVTYEDGKYIVTTASVVENEPEGARSSQVRLRIIPEQPVSTSDNLKISFDFKATGILNLEGNLYETMPVSLRLYDSVDGTYQANTIGYIRANVPANIGTAVNAEFYIEDMENGGGASTLTEIKSIGVQVDMYGAGQQYAVEENDGYFTISNIKIEEVVEEPEAPAVTFDYSKYETTILAGTDFQAENNEVGAQNITNIIGAVKESGLLSADAFLFCGDYENTSGKATTAGINALKEAVGDFVPDKDNHVYIQGNHDAPIGTTGLAPSGNNDPESGDYGVFVIHDDDYGTENNIARTMDTAANLADYLNEKLEAGYDKPIFVMSHVPLYYSLRTLNLANAKHADHIFHVLNQAGEQGLEIIFLAGHDHSKAYESYLGGAAVYLAKGDKINIAQSSVVNFKEETLNFTYMNAGYVGYYNVGSGADNVINMVVIGIDEDTDTVDVYRFDKKGLHNLKSEGKLLEGEEDLYTANTTVYTSPQTIASSSVNYEKEITTLPAVSINGEKLVDINLPIDDVSEITWTGSSAVTVSNADGVGGRDNVIKAEGLADSNNNTVGVKLADGFAFQDGDIISYSFDVYSETEINPDIWLRNHASGLKPFVSFYSGVMATNKWTTVARTVEFAELDFSTDYDWTTVGNYAIYLRPRQNATVYLDNIKVTVTRPIEVRGNIVDVDLPLDEASELTWKTDAVTVTEADGISGRDSVLKLEGLSNSNNNTAGIKIADGFAFQKGDIITYSLDVYSDTVTHPDLWLRNHNGSVLSPFTTFYHEVKTGEWTTITKTVSFDGLESKYDWTTVGNYALYVRPREAGTVYVDNFKLTVSRKDYVPPHEHEYGEWIMEDDANHKKTCECGDSVIEAHSWDEGVLTKEPTVAEEGVKTYTCTVCSGTISETIPTKPSGGGRLGDLDGDGEIGVKDVISLRRFITSGFNVTVNEGAADVNKDGRVGVKDVVLIRRFIAGGYGVEI